MKKSKLIVLFAALLSQMAWAESNDPEVVPSVDLQKYAGSWYEIGHLPNFFQNLCERSEANYTLDNDGRVSVLNTCFRNEKVFTTIEGKAFAPKADEPTKLVVDFGFLRKGNYWIIGLDQNYQWAVVSGPQKESLFILSRQAPMAAELLSQILESLKKQGFDTSKIIFDKY